MVAGKEDVPYLVDKYFLITNKINKMANEQTEYHFYHMSANWIDIINFLSTAIVMYLPHNMLRVTRQHLRQIDTDCDCDTYFEFCCDWNEEKMRNFLDHHNMRNINDSIVYEGSDKWEQHPLNKEPKMPKTDLRI
jgi:hypothetical protein